jgi:hypothetical protein
VSFGSTRGHRAATRHETPVAAKGDAEARFMLDMIQRARRSGMFAVWHTLTPSMARHIIANHMPEGSNRRLRRPHVARLAAAMTAGHWNGNTHQGIAFTVDGIVNDGQHRIHACAQSGVAIDMMMVFGQPRAAFEVIDQDAVHRDAATLLELDGLHTGSSTLAAGLARGLLGIKKGATGAAIRQVLKAEVLAFVRDNVAAVNAAVKDSSRIVGGIRSHVSPSNIGTALFLIRERGSPERVEEFVTALASGANLAANNPILVCREGLRAGAFGGGLRGATDRRPHEIAAVILAWNLWRCGRTTRSRSSLSYNAGDRFPKAQP